MDIEVDTKISKDYKNVKITITAPELNEEVKHILNNITTISDNKDVIVAAKDNEIFLIKVADIFYFFSDDKYNYAKTEEGIFKVKDRLYELEEKYSKNKFIRISSAYIINLNKTKSFDVSQIGSIVAKMEDGKNILVSKRRIRDVKEFLNGRK